MAETDAVLAPPEGQPDESPASEMPILGLGINEVDTDDDGPEVEGGQAETASREVEDTRSSTDAPSSEDDSEGSMRRADYTRKTMELADDRRALERERATLQGQQQEWLNRREAQVAARQQPARSAPAPASAEMSAQQLSSAVQSTQKALADGNLTAEQHLQTQQELVALQGLQSMRGEIDELREFRKQVSPLLKQTAQSVTQLTQAQKDVQTQKRLEAVQEAQQMFGEDTVRQFGSQVYMHFNAEDSGKPMVNPTTSEPYTPSEIISMYSGVSTEEAASARQRNRSSRQQAKQGTRPQGAQQQAPVQQAAALQSRDEALAEIANTLS